MNRRNPYVILGIDYGSPKGAASRHFAAAARRMKRNPGGPYTKEDLTWALSQIEKLDANPSDAVDIFRVPADPQVFTPAGPGLLEPPPAPLERTTRPGDPGAIALLEALSARELLQATLTELAPSIPLPNPHPTEGTR